MKMLIAVLVSHIPIGPCSFSVSGIRTLFEQSPWVSKKRELRQSVAPIMYVLS